MKEMSIVTALFLFPLIQSACPPGYTEVKDSGLVQVTYIRDLEGWKYLPRRLEYRYVDNIFGFDRGFRLNFLKPDEGCLQVGLEPLYGNDDQLDRKMGDAGWREHARGDKDQKLGDLIPKKDWRVYRHDDIPLVKPRCLKL